MTTVISGNDYVIHFSSVTFVPTHSIGFSNRLVFLMTLVTQKSIGRGYNECIVQDNLHVKPDLPATAPPDTHSAVAAQSADFVADILRTCRIMGDKIVFSVLLTKSFKL